MNRIMGMIFCCGFLASSLYAEEAVVIVEENTGPTEFVIEPRPAHPVIVASAYARHKFLEKIASLGLAVLRTIRDHPYFTALLAVVLCSDEEQSKTLKVVWTLAGGTLLDIIFHMADDYEHKENEHVHPGDAEGSKLCCRIPVHIIEE